MQKILLDVSLIIKQLSEEEDEEEEEEGEEEEEEEEEKEKQISGFDPSLFSSSPIPSSLSNGQAVLGVQVRQIDR